MSINFGVQISNNDPKSFPLLEVAAVKFALI